MTTTELLKAFVEEQSKRENGLKVLEATVQHLEKIVKGSA